MADVTETPKVEPGQVQVDKTVGGQVHEIES
jgi:hypothetical protein